MSGTNTLNLANNKLSSIHEGVLHGPIRAKIEQNKVRVSNGEEGCGGEIVIWLEIHTHRRPAVPAPLLAQKASFSPPLPRL